MGLRPTRENENQRCRPREGVGPSSVLWIPAFAGMTPMERFSGKPQEVLSGTKEGLPQFVETTTAGILRFAQNDMVQGFFHALLKARAACELGQR